MWSSIILCSLLPLVLAEDFRIFHRIHNPTAAPTPFSQRGVLTLTSSGPVITASDNLADNLLDFAETAHGLTSALYQVALESDGDEHEGHWSTSSVKACHLSQSTAETFIIHQTHDGKPFSLNYFISPIPHDGSCPKPNSASSPPKYLHSSNTTVLLQSPRLPPRPELRTPPPLTAEGQPVQPIPEKSFIQKYWIYILIALGALLLSGGPEEETPKEGGR